MQRTQQKPVVLIVDSVYNRAPQLFSSISDLHILEAPTGEEALARMVKEKQAAAVVLNVDSYRGPLYQSFGNKGLLARFGVGCDGVDFDKASKHGLVVTNTPGVLDSTVAEFTVFLAGEVLRMAGRCSNEIKQGRWNPVMGRELHGKTFAILGLGNIGKRVSQILSFGFGVDVLALKKHAGDPDRLKEKYGVNKISTEFSEIAPHADIVSLHLPANSETHHFLDRDRLHQLKRGAVLINTGRGALVDEIALYEALKSGQLAGAGLDVFAREPYKPADPDADLRTLSNVILTPHIGSSTKECSRRMAKRVLQNIRYFLDKEYDQMDVVTR
ncbi:2-hydroxyacid dehydrogenase [Halalkalibaculum sp. DA3122]|uniref:2-hydroxyacid dehydrogenase n=1 Tax=unclassified Halalkalibaculum TaxID=2964617 RepID=UPI003754087B